MKSSTVLFLAAWLAAASSSDAAPTNGEPAAPKRQLGHAATHHAGMAIAPRGEGNILYDQTTGYDSTGAPVGNYSDVSIQASDSAGADDFVVGTGGWTVSGFNFLAFNQFDDSGVQAITNLADVSVYPDAGGQPATSATCTSLGSTNSASAFDSMTTLTSITLNTPCVLTAGTYWVSLAYEYSGLPSTYVPVFWGLSNSSNGATAVWRQPQGPTCADWTAVTNCFDPPTSDHDYAFQVIGTAGMPGTGGGDLTLALTGAVDNGDPSQCGMSSDLTVNAGQTVNLCYTITNHTGHALSYQTLSDTLAGVVFSQQQQSVPDGGTFQYNRQIVAGPSTNGAVTATWSAQDHQPNYTFDNSGVSRFIDITGTGTPLGLADDASADIAMPFSFNFYGVTTNVLSISNNGGINVGTPQTTLGSNNFGLPTLFLNNTPVILPLWDDFAASTGDVYTDIRGDAPNRQLIVEWYDRVHFSPNTNTDGATFEVIFNESDGSFSFEYQDVEFSCNNSSGPVDCSGGLSATVGIQDTDVFEDPVRSIYTQYAYDEDAVSDGESIVWTAVPITTATATSTLTLDVGAAIVAATPAALSATASAGAQTTATLAIGNSGTLDLAWTLDEASTANSRAHFSSTPYSAPVQPPTHASSAHVPRSSEAKKYGPSSKHAAPFGSQALPAYGVLPLQETLYSFDANDATALTAIGAMGSLDNLYDTGAFANNDFSKIYLAGPQGTLAYPYTSGLVAVDTTTGAISIVDANPDTQTGGFDVGTLQWDASTSTMWAVADENQDVNPPPGFQPTSHFFTVDIASGTFTPAFDLTNTLISGVAFDAAGTMYAIDLLTDTLLTIDKASGQSQAIGPLGVDLNGAQSMDFDPRSGTLWLAGCVFAGFGCDGQMFTVDTGTGTATPTQSGSINGDGEEMTAFSIALPKGPCANPTDVPWLSVSPASGTTAAADSTPVTVTFDATNLIAGTYSATLCVDSNDLSRVVLPVPVSFTVSAPTDTIFKDGFDG